MSFAYTHVLLRLIFPPTHINSEYVYNQYHHHHHCICHTGTAVEAKKYVVASQTHSSTTTPSWRNFFRNICGGGDKPRCIIWICPKNRTNPTSLAAEWRERPFCHSTAKVHKSIRVSDYSDIGLIHETSCFTHGLNSTDSLCILLPYLVCIRMSYQFNLMQQMHTANRL